MAGAYRRCAASRALRPHCRRTRCAGAGARLLRRAHHLRQRAPDSRLANEEVFGPVLAVLCYETVETP
ncbi:hypothetical protein ACTMU2_11795 [Cupriavidus basilensis]